MSPDEVIQRMLLSAEPPFPMAEVVIYGQVVELLPDEAGKAGIKSLVKGSNLARVRVIEGFRGAVAGQVLVLKTEDRVNGNQTFAASAPAQLMAARGGVVETCARFQLKPPQLVELRQNFKRYPDLETRGKAR